MNMNGIMHGQRCLLVNYVITIDKQFYSCTEEVIKSNRMTHFKTKFYPIDSAKIFYYK